MDLSFLIKNIFSKRKLRKLNQKELLEKLKERYLKDNIIEIICPRCKTNLGNFSHNYLGKYGEIYCPECKEFIGITINLNFKEDIFEEKDIFKTYLTDDELYELYLKEIKFLKTKEIKDKEN